MNHFPPPSPHDHRATDLEPIDTAAPSRRRGGTIAALTAGVLIGGLVAGTQFAAASTPLPTDEPAPVDASVPGHAERVEGPGVVEIGVVEIGVVEIGIDEIEDPAWEAWGTCFDKELGLDAKDATAGSIEPTDDQFEAAETACADLMPEELRAEMESWGAYKTCLSEQLGDLGDAAVVFGDGAAQGSVSVDIPAGDDIDFSTYNFGEGDGSITITKTGDDVSVAVDGDVTTFDHDALEAEWDAHDKAWQAADEVCGDLLPEGAFDVDDFIEPFEIDGEFGEDVFDVLIEFDGLEKMIDGQLVD